jgi:hypothetical protein
MKWSPNQYFLYDYLEEVLTLDTQLGSVVVIGIEEVGEGELVGTL